MTDQGISPELRLKQKRWWLQGQNEEFNYKRVYVKAVTKEDLSRQRSKLRKLTKAGWGWP